MPSMQKRWARVQSERSQQYFFERLKYVPRREPYPQVDIMRCSYISSCEMEQKLSTVHLIRHFRPEHALKKGLRTSKLLNRQSHNILIHCHAPLWKTIYIIINKRAAMISNHTTVYNWLSRNHCPPSLWMSISILLQRHTSRIELQS